MEEVAENELAYAANCPVTVDIEGIGDDGLPKLSQIEGTVLLCQPLSSNDEDSTKEVVYTVMMRMGGGSQAKYEEGIDAKRVRYRLESDADVAEQNAHEKNTPVVKQSVENANRGGESRDDYAKKSRDGGPSKDIDIQNFQQFAANENLSMKKGRVPESIICDSGEQMDHSGLKSQTIGHDGHFERTGYAPKSQNNYSAKQMQPADHHHNVMMSKDKEGKKHNYCNILIPAWLTYGVDSRNCLLGEFNIFSPFLCLLLRILILLVALNQKIFWNGVSTLESPILLQKSAKRQTAHWLLIAGTLQGQSVCTFGPMEREAADQIPSGTLNLPKKGWKMHLQPTLGMTLPLEGYSMI